MKYLHLTILFLITYSEFVQAQIPAPNLKCVKRDTLIWDVPTVSCGSVTGYEIYAARNFNGPYQLLTTINNTSQTRYFHNNTEGGSFFYFMTTKANCSGLIALSSDTLDNQPPAVVPISTLNVLNNNSVEIRWRRSSSPEVTGYIVYKKTPAGLLPLTTLPNRDSLRFVDVNATPSVGSEEYQVLAIDGCGNTSLFDVNHRTILAKTRQSKCDQTITVSWNLYQNWLNPISKHEIWVSIGGRNPYVYASVGAKDTAFVFKDVKDKVRYTFYVRAVQSLTGVTAKSNDVTIVADILQPVSELVIESLSVNNKNQVELLWRWNPDAKVDSVRIWRAESDSTPYSIVRAYKAVLPIDFTSSFNDTTVNAGTKQYFYFIETKDQCGTFKKSNIGATLFLKGKPETGRTNRLNWTPFILQGTEKIGYELTRIVGGVPTILSTPLIDTAQTETTDVAQPDESRVCYRMAIVFNNILPNGTPVETRSNSNTICIEQFSSIFMPNAFTPGGLNPEFKPVLVYPDNIKSYQMLIYDRWGRFIFQTTTPSVGWDGKHNGSPLPQGTYTYFVRVERSVGGIFEQKGVVLLLR